MQFPRCGSFVVERVILAVMMLAGTTIAHAQPVPLSTLVSPSDLVADTAGDALIADATGQTTAADDAPAMELTQVAAAPDADPAVLRFARLVEWRHTFGTWRRATGPVFPLYVSYAALQIVDVHSTTRGLDRGQIEANVVLRGLAGSPVPLTLVKASAAGATIYFVERVRRKSRKAAILMMVGLNSAYATIVATNYHR